MNKNMIEIKGIPLPRWIVSRCKRVAKRARLGLCYEDVLSAVLMGIEAQKDAKPANSESEIHAVFAGSAIVFIENKIEEKSDE